MNELVGCQFYDDVGTFNRPRESTWSYGSVSNFQSIHRHLAGYSEDMLQDLLCTIKTCAAAEISVFHWHCCLPNHRTGVLTEDELMELQCIGEGLGVVLYADDLEAMMKTFSKEMEEE